MKKRNNLLKRMVAVLMLLAMVTGVFMWNRMDVKAASYDWGWDGKDGSTGKFCLERRSDGKDNDWNFPVRMSSGQIVSLAAHGDEQMKYTIVYYHNGSMLVEDVIGFQGGGVKHTIGSNPACTGYTEWLMTPVYSSTNNDEVWKWRMDAVIEEAPSTGGSLIHLTQRLTPILLSGR